MYHLCTTQLTCFTAPSNSTMKFKIKSKILIDLFSVYDQSFSMLFFFVDLVVWNIFMFPLIIVARYLVKHLNTHLFQPLTAETEHI